MLIILQIDLTNLFSNIEEIYAVNVSFWLSTLKPVMNMVGLNCLIFAVESSNNRCSPSNLLILLKFKNNKKNIVTQAGYFCMSFVLQARHTKKLLNPFYMADGFSTVSNYFFRLYFMKFPGYQQCFTYNILVHQVIKHYPYKNSTRMHTYEVHMCI